jgi:hypothetical protein
VSQPQPDASWPRGRPGLSRSNPSRRPANPWSAERIEVPVPVRAWEVADPPSNPGLGEEWPPDAEEQDAAAERSAAAERGSAGPRGRIALTGRGAVAGMLVLFFFSLLLATWLQWGVLAGVSFVIGGVAAAWYTKPRDLLTVAVSPPLLFFGALVCVKALTAQGSAIISTLAGTALTLANVAPWLFAGVILYLIVAWVRGLPQCVSDLRRDLRPDLAPPRSGSTRPAAGQSAYSPGPRRYR